MHPTASEKDGDVVDRFETIEPGRESDKANDAILDSFSESEAKRIVRHVDLRLLPTLALMYCVSLIDRKPAALDPRKPLADLDIGTNVGFAVIAGAGVDLKLTVGNRLNIALLVFFPTYIAFQPLATILLRKVGPRAFLPTITVFWGIVILGMGFVKQWTGLAALRVVLGLFEAGFFPGCAYLLSCWYTRYQLHKRNAVFWLLANVIGSFSGIMTYGFIQLNGKGSGAGLGQHYGPTKANPKLPYGQQHGIAGWRWIYIFEGVITCIIGAIAYFTIVDFPELASRSGFLRLKFLTKEESDFMVARIERDRADAILEEFNWKEYLCNGLDLKVWGFAALFGLNTVLTYSLGFFLPIILQVGMGFSIKDAQMLVCPPYVTAGIWTFINAYLGDKYRIRSPILIGNALLAILGLGLMGFVKTVGVRYFGVFLTCSTSISPFLLSPCPFPFCFPFPFSVPFTISLPSQSIV